MRPWKLSFKVTMVERPRGLAVLARRLDHALVGLGAELEKNTFRMPVRSQSISARTCAGLGVVEVAGVGQGGKLPCHRLGPNGIGDAEDVDGDAAAQVDVLPARLVPTDARPRRAQR